MVGNSIKTMTINNCDSGFFPKSVTLDFGAAGACASCDGRVRKGKLAITFSAPWKNAGAVAAITTENYSVNGRAVSGKMVLTDINGIDTSSDALTPKFRRQVSGISGVGNATIQSTTSGSAIQYRCDHTIEQIAGHNTPHKFNDDVMTVFGIASGVNSKSRSFSVIIHETTKLKKAAICKWIQDGTLEVTPENLATRKINFAHPGETGSGICDSLAQVTVNGNTSIIGME